MKDIMANFKAMRIAVTGLAFFAVFIASSGWAFAQGRFSGSGVSIEFAGWVDIEPYDSALEKLIQITPADREQPPFRTCDIERATVAYPDGTTQSDVNGRLVNAEASFWSSPVLSEEGRIVDVAISEVDGVAMVDVVIRGDGHNNPSLTRARQFVLVGEAGSGHYYLMTCISMGAPNAEQIAEIEAIISSLRIVR